MYKVEVQMGYDDLTFKFENANVAENFANTAFSSIVREKDNKGNLKNVTININSCMTTREEEEEEEED